MTVPYEHYIRFLVTKGVLTTDDVNERLSELGLPRIKDVTLEAHEALVSGTLPAPVWEQVDGTRPREGSFLHYMRILDVEEFWYLEKPYRDQDSTRRARVKLVHDINQDPQLRVTLNALLLKAMPAPDIAQVVNSRYAAMLREEHIVLYRKYFFNPERMTRRAWRDYLRICEPHESKVYFTALSEPLDVLKTELELPAKISSSETLQYLLTKSYLKAKQFLGVNTPEGSREARFWIDSVVQLVDKYEKYRATDATDFGNALQMEFDFVDDVFDVPDKEVLAEIAEKLRKEESAPAEEAKA